MVLSIASVRGNGTYYTSLGRDDYLLAGGEPQGIWLGEGAKALGLSGAVSDLVYRRLMGGFSPDGTTALVRNAGTPHRRPGWDFTFSVPKSVSILWSVASQIPGLEKSLKEAHWAAVRRAMTYLEQAAGQAREGLGGVSRSPVRLVVAGFEHGTNRNLDAQLHCHCVVFNLGVRLDGESRAIVSKALYRQKMTVGALYRAELASQLRQRFGLQLAAISSWFEVVGVPHSLIEACSSRRKEILGQLAQSGFAGAKAAKIAALDSRKKKSLIPREELFRRWQAQARSHGFDAEKLRALIRPNLAPRIAEVSPRIIAASVNKLLKNQSYFSERELIRTIAEGVQSTGVSADRILAAVRKMLPALVAVGEHRSERQFTTTATLELERKLLALAVAGRVTTRHTLSVRTVQRTLASHSLSSEQAQALRHITGRSGLVHVVQGLAGTGKSTLLAAARQAFEAEGFQVIGCSLSGKAAEGLTAASGIPSHTIARLLHQWNLDQPEIPRLNSRNILVIDEAAMVGTRQLGQLIEYATKADCRVILVGDSRQLPAVEAGAPFQSLARVLGASSLTDIRRQFESWGRVMVRHFADGDVEEGVDILQKRGLIHIGVTPEATTQKLLSEWAREADLLQTLILAGTVEEVDWLNREAQKIRRGAGLLGGTPCVAGGREFFRGDRILFRRNDRKLGVQNGSFGSFVEERNGSAVIHLDQTGRNVFIPINNEHLRLGYAVTTHKSQGATVNRAYVLFSDAMQSRESTYVQVSRAREFTKLYLSQDQAGDADLGDAVRAMERSQAKCNALDLKFSRIKTPRVRHRLQEICLSR